MRLRIVCIVALAALVAVGCSKDKKKDTTPTQQTATAPGPSTDSTDAPVAESSAADPASLGEAIFFEFDSATLDAEARDVLETNVEWLKENPARSILIEGHTDEVGTPEYNVALGEQRARTAKEYMARMGIDPARIQILSYGEERPWSGDDAKNRRSMFIATK